MRGLYPILDLDTLAARRLEPLPFARAVLVAAPPLLQLRAKTAAPRDVVALLRELVPLCRAAGTRLIANDRPDLALIAGADGVHVGQTDLAVDDVRRIAPHLLTGVSTHDLAQLREALASRPGYVAFGPVFATSSKRDPDPVVAVAGLEQAARLARDAGIPLVAIGGITLERAADVARTGAVGAVIADLFAGGTSPDAIARRALELHRALSEP